MFALPKQFNHLVGRAMHLYQMLADGDRVMIAVSGGIDSLVLAWLLKEWRHKAPIRYELLAVHLDMGFGGVEYDLVKEQLRRIDLPMLLERTEFGHKALLAENGKSGCYHCARQRRSRLFSLADEHHCNKLAFGHHQEDIIETFFLNLFYGGNLSAMAPKQELFAGKLALIRPLAMVGKKQIVELGQSLGITPVTNPCPLAADSRRETIRTWLTPLYEKDPALKATIFASLGNVRTDYLLTPLAPLNITPPATK
ncbi:tRNA lysidine(34) synthetase [Thiovibrio frasassiensis]|uniref:tRNA 2-thiocytidine(32) synthetase TtcA n=1 Tax=Thiovibrio frasassiensis TaxID=2984131 RepID=A0A9X4MKE1_9BACT|nr:ATP-binding protein [Thiovibrio frasassiensis]MDG4476434.1 tRNA 2-thiocytidine(32) synthetase TtcA [Thiovibrio frasassiensis]